MTVVRVGNTAVTASDCVTALDARKVLAFFREKYGSILKLDISKIDECFHCRIVTERGWNIDEMYIRKG